ncbi:MAG: DUF4339 domain-containing protein [Actinomycetia bacterium]|nr:DUF4339 domain-containing protein [Actinomycetes bacterium]
MTDLPALDQPQAYVVVGPDDQRGPYTLELLISEVVAGRLNDNTPVWWPGMADWTTMSGHAGIAAEIERRRNPAPAPEPEPTAFAPPVEAPAPAEPAPAAPPAGQYESYEYGYGQSGGGYPAAASPGQDYSTGAYQAEETVSAQPDISPDPSPAAFGAVTSEDAPSSFAPNPAEGQDAVQLAGETVAADVAGEDAGVFGVGATTTEPFGTEGAIEVPAVEVTPADFVAVDTGPQVGYRASGAAEGLDPVHGTAFAELIRRSRARADAAAIVDSVDQAITGAVAAAAAAQGFEAVNRDDTGDRHDMSFRAADNTTVEVSVGRVTGADMAVRDGHVDLDVSCTSTTYAGSMDAGTGEHGEITVRAAEYGGASIASVSLMLPLADYVSADMVTDEGALRRDLEATVASVRARLA